MISAVIFDCDGVLVDSEILAHEVESQVLGSIGLHYEREDFIARFMGMSNKAFYEALEADGFARLGRSIRGEIQAPINAMMRKAVAERLTEVPGAGAAVAAVCCLKAVASSSTNAALEHKLRKTGLWAFFAPHVYSAEHVTHAKPAPDLFLHAAAALAIPPSACLVIEDSVNGVIAGRAAGMEVWGLMAGGHMREPARARLTAAGAHRVVDSWADAAALLAAL